jgi:hypothetical protein
VVEHVPPNPKVEGSNLAANAGSEPNAVKLFAAVIDSCL